MINRKRTTAQKTAYSLLDLQLIELERVQLYAHAVRMLEMPNGWRTLEDDCPVQPRKTSLTLRLDADVVKWYRALGSGYQARMNGVLRAYMLALVSRAIESRGTKDWRGKPI